MQFWLNFVNIHAGHIFLLGSETQQIALNDVEKKQRPDMVVCYVELGKRFKMRLLSRTSVWTEPNAGLGKDPLKRRRFQASTLVTQVKVQGVMDFPMSPQMYWTTRILVDDQVARKRLILKFSFNNCVFFFQNLAEFQFRFFTPDSQVDFERVWSE